MTTIVKLKPPSKKTCPCGKTTAPDMERIRRTLLMRILFFWLPLKRY